MNLAERLVSDVSRLKFSDLPQEVVHEAKRRVVDAVGCALGALKSRPACSVKKVIEELGSGRPRRPVAGRWATGQRRASLLGARRQTSIDLAAFYNGVLIRYLDYNDTYLSREPCHPSDNLSAALAVAEAFDRNGRDFLTALVAGYEVICRLCDAASLRRRGWDHVTYGTLSTSLIAAKLAGLSPEKALQALSLSMVPNVALRQTRAGEVSMWKACAFANASRNGVLAALLARGGLTGPSEIFEGRFGFFKQVSGRFRWPVVQWGRSPWKILKTSLKYYPAEYHAQSAIEAALRLKAHLTGTRPLRRILIETFEAAVSIIACEPEKWRPASRETADHSLPYLVAVALVDGDVGPRQFSPRRIRDASLRRLLSKVIVRERREFSNAYPEAIPNRVTVEEGRPFGLAQGGHRWSEEVRYPRGHWRNPMSDLEIEEKFLRLTGPVLKPSRAEEVLDRLWSLEKAKSLGPLMGSLAVRS